MSTTSILFVCLGNICRSPMAEGVFKHLLESRGLTKAFTVDSAGLIAYHRGELADSRMRTHAARRGYHLTHRSRPVTEEDFAKFDLIIGMDEQNIRELKMRATSPEQAAKIYRMTDFCTRMLAEEVPDPYYGGSEGFEYVIDLLEDAGEGLLNKLVPPASDR
jgi:protein-tyrosine phosphatase